MCRAGLYRSALETPDLGAFNDGSSVEIQPLGTDLITFEVAEAPHFSAFSGEIFSINFQFCGNLATSKLVRSAPSGCISKFVPPSECASVETFQ